MALISEEHEVRNQERSLSRSYKAISRESHCFTQKEKKMQPTESAGKGDRKNKELVKHLGGRVKK